MLTADFGMIDDEIGSTSFGGPRFLQAFVGGFPTTAFTVSLKVRSTSPGMLISLGDDETGSVDWTQARFSIDIWSQSVTVGFGQTRGVVVSLATNLLDGATHHLAVTWSQSAAGANGATVVVYVDGRQVGQRSWVFTDDGVEPGFIPRIIASGPLFIGYRPAQHNELQPSGIFAGALRDLRVWARVMTPAEVASDQTAVVAGTEPGLYLSLPLDPASRDYPSNRFVDQSPNRFEALEIVIQDNAVSMGSVWSFNGFPVGSRTVTMWLRCGGDAGGTHLFTYSDYSNSEPMDNAGDRWSIADPSGLRISSSGSVGVSVNDGKWHHVAVVCHREAGEPIEDIVYIDGVQRARMAVHSEGTLTDHQRLILGGWLATDATDSVYRGEMAGVAIWSGRRSHQQIVDEMHGHLAASSPQDPFPSTLVAWWPLAPESVGLGVGQGIGVSIESSRWGSRLVRPTKSETPVDELDRPIYFVEKHEPALKSGAYSVRVQQTIQGERFESTADFHVAGPRFHLTPSDIQAMFPPPGSMGDHAHALPHIVLTRSTLPWERLAMASTPWLAVLVFDEGEIKDAGVKPLKALALVDAAGRAVEADSEAGESGDDPVTYITVAADTLKTLLPSAADLKLLAHVRRDEDDNERAVVLGNRLPKADAPGIVHLVSLEGRYADGRLSPAAGDVTLISLATWRFSCVAGGPSLAGQLNALDVASAQTTTPLRHRLRNGQKSISWYRSPFSPEPAGVGDPDEAIHADALLGMAAGRMDVTYAAAWELGRLLTLANKHVASQLFLWKRWHARDLMAVRRLVVHHGPNHGSAQAALPPDLPAVIDDWFDTLRLLRPVPFQYLIPDEAMLPPESLRLFKVDRRWLAHLLHGAFAVGHAPTRTPPADLPEAPDPDDAPLCGFLLRSSAVTQWPHLTIQASGKRVDTTDGELPEPLTRVRLEVLSPGILLALFEGERIRSLDVGLKPATLHAGFDVSAAGVVKKRPRDASGQPQTAVDIALTPMRRFQAEAFKATLESLNLFDGPITSAEFALALIDGVERVRIVAKNE
ncbi:MAG: LamG domain-containing protein [Rhodothermales bacterium]|nr:LamG domain-containing protein [Rhodothermales bacterium]